MSVSYSAFFYLIIIFGSVTMVVYQAGIFIFGIRYKPNRRLNRYLAASGIYGTLAKEGQVNSNSSESHILKFRRILEAIGKILEIRRYSRDIELELLRADIPLRCHEFAGGLFLTILGFSFAAMSVTHKLLPSLIAGLLGAIIPVVLVKMRKAHRLARFNAQICDALGVMSNSLRAGYSFLQSMDLCSTELDQPLSVEFGRALREIGLGATAEEALTNMLKRVPSSDLDIVITAVLIQRQVGGNLAEITDKISHTIRERVKIQGDIKALTAQGRLSGMIITLLPFALAGFLFTVNKSYMMPLFTHPLGKVMISIALVGEILGAMAISKITKIEV